MRTSDERGGVPAAISAALALVVVAVMVGWVVLLATLDDLGRATGAAVDAGVGAPLAGLWQPSSTATVPDPAADAPLAAADVSAVALPDPSWTERTSAAVGLPVRVLQAYAAADLRLGVDQPSCALSWATLAGVGWVESRHGTVRGNWIDPDGRPVTGPILGVALTGEGPVAAISDTDAGVLDGDTTWDRALGPLQLLPTTWARWEADGDGDGALDPQDVDDAALAAGRYLCASGSPLDDPAQWRQAVLGYNRSDVYVADVMSATNYYAERSRPPA